MPQEIDHGHIKDRLSICHCIIGNIPEEAPNSTMMANPMLHSQKLRTELSLICRRPTIDLLVLFLPLKIFFRSHHHCSLYQVLWRKVWSGVKAELFVVMVQAEGLGEPSYPHNYNMCVCVCVSEKSREKKKKVGLRLVLNVLSGTSRRGVSCSHRINCLPGR